MALSPLTQDLLMGPPRSRQGSTAQPKKNPIDTFLTTPGGSFLMNILAQQGFSPVPHSQIGAIGKAALATQQQGRERTQDSLREDLIRSQVGLNKTKADAAGAGRRIVQSAQPLSNGNIGYLDAFTGKVVDTGVEAGGKGQIIDLEGVGQVEYDPVQKTLTTVNPENVIRSGIAGRELVESEAGRGRVLDSSGGFSAVPGSAAAISEEEGERKRTAGALMKSIQAQTVVEDVSRLNQQMDDLPFGRAAALQQSLSPVLQTDAFRNGNALIESVKGNVGVDSLLRIKATGAGLGQVPQSQLDLLSRLLGELSLTQSREQFVKTWNRTGDVYQQIWDASDKEMRELNAVPPEVFRGLDDSGELPAGVTQEEWNNMPPEDRKLFE